MTFLTRWLTDFFRELANQVINWVPGVTAPSPYWEAPWAARAREVIVMIAWTLLTLRVAVEIWKLYIAREAGEAILAPGVLLRRVAYAAFLIPATGWFIPWCARLAITLSAAVAGVGADANPRAALLQILQGLLNGSMLLGALVISLLVVLALAIAFLLLAIQASIRGVELAIAFILGPALAISAAGHDDFLASGTAAVWWREVLVLTLTQVIQTLLMLAILNYTLASAFEITSVLTSLAFAWVAIKSPSILRHYAYSSGVGRAAGSGAMAMATTVLMKLPW